MQFIDLATQQQRIKDQITRNIEAVLAHGKYIMGPEIQTLETRLAEYVDVRHAISCSSGTDALLMALMAYDVGPGDAVFTTPFTFVATAEVISLLGATPVFVDIDPVTYNISPAALMDAVCALEEKDPTRYPLPLGFEQLTPKGIIPVDLFGLCAEFDEINALARSKGLFVLEDACQSFGAQYHGKRACSLADVAATSFFPAKPLGGYGDGGMVFTDNDELAAKLISIRVHGSGSDKYDNVRLGINGRLDTLQAAVLLAKFDIFPEEVELRQEVARRYTALLEKNSAITCPSIAQGFLSAWAQYSILSPKREETLAALKSAGIPSAVYYPIPLHLQGAYRYLGYTKGSFPVCEKSSNAIFSLPMHPYLSADDQQRIAEIVLVL